LGASTSIISQFSEDGDIGILAVDYDEDGLLILRNKSIQSARGSVFDPDINASNFSWLWINNKSITPNSIMECFIVYASPDEVCRTQGYAGSSSTDGGFFYYAGGYFVDTRVGYHVFYMDLRTETFAYSRQEESNVEYWLVHQGQAKLVETDFLAPVAVKVFLSPPYGYEGSEANKSDAQAYYDSSGSSNPATKVNPIAGIYHIDEYDSVDAFAPVPARFGVEVNVDQSVLFTAKFPSGAVENYHSTIPNLGTLIGPFRSNFTLLPLALR